MTDTTTFGHALIGFMQLLRRQQAVSTPVQPLAKTEKPKPRRPKRQAMKASLKKRQAKRKVRNQMARQSRRINRR